MKKIILILTVLFIFGCSNNENNNSNDATNIDNSVAIFLKSSKGFNLINTSNYNSNNFKIYYKLNNEVVEIYNPSLDFPRNFYINNETNPISMKLFLNHSSLEANPTTIIKWNNLKTDTIKTYFRRGTENSTDYEICEKIWLNNELVWDITSTSAITAKEITIIK